MGYEQEAPIKPFVIDTPSIRRRKLSAVAAANERAVFRLTVARMAASMSGSLEQKKSAIAGAIAAGLLPGGRAPSIETIRQLQAKYQGGAVSAADYRDDLNPRGPRPAPLPAPFVDTVKRLATQHTTISIPQLVHLVKSAPGLGIDPERITEWRIRRTLALIGTHTIAAARHGSRAAEFDALPRGTYPTNWTYEMCNLDEGDSGYRMLGFDRFRGIWVSARVPAIIIRDHRSGAIIGHHLVDPTRRANDEGTGCMRDGFDSDDVMAALLSIASPELAPAGCREFAGALPQRLRWDNAQAHRTVEALLHDRARIVRDEGTEDPLDEDLAEAEEPIIVSERIGKRRPERNGAVERLMRVLKPWIVGIHGHVDEEIPEDCLVPGLDLGRDRSEVAATGTRQPRLIPVTLDVLPTIEPLRAEMAQAVDRYNDHKLRRHDMSPRFAARRYMPRSTRRGDDLIRALGAESHRVTRDGIEVQRDGKSVVFKPMANSVLLQIGTTAQVYVDPLLRALWLEQGRQLVILKPQHEFAASADAGDVARTIGDAARAASDAAAAARAQSLDAEFGVGTAERGMDAYVRALDTRPGDESAPAAPAPATTEPAPSSAGALSTYDFDPDALMPDASSR